jgi:hypothetical protein
MLQKFWGAKEKNEKNYDEKKKVRKKGRKKGKREKWEGNKIKVKK